MSGPAAAGWKHCVRGWSCIHGPQSKAEDKLFPELSHPKAFLKRGSD